MTMEEQLDELQELLASVPTRETLLKLHAFSGHVTPLKEKRAIELAALFESGGYESVEEILPSSLDELKEELRPRGYLKLALETVLKGARKAKKTTEEAAAMEAAQKHFFRHVKTIHTGSAPSNIKLSSLKSSMRRTAFLSFTQRPLSVEAKESGERLATFLETKMGGVDLLAVLTEATYTSNGIVTHPGQMRHMGNSKAAGHVLPENYGDGEAGKLVLPCKNSMPGGGFGIDTPLKPTMSMEWKSIPDNCIEEIFQTSSGHIQASFFQTEPRGLQSPVFYDKPPSGIAMLGCGPAVVAVFKVEMVGILHFSIYAGGYSLGSEDHEEHVKELEETEAMDPVVNLDECTSLVPCKFVDHKTVFTEKSFNGNFYKVIRFDFYADKHCPSNWRRLYTVYEKLGEVMEEKSLPESLVKARLLFGEYQVAVEMPFLEGFKEIQDKKLNGAQARLLREALVFLFENGFYYTDIRCPNILVKEDEEDKLCLIDYDDMEMFDAEKEKEKALGFYRKFVSDDSKTGPFFWSIKEILQAFVRDKMGDLTEEIE